MVGVKEYIQGKLLHATATGRLRRPSAKVRVGVRERNEVILLERIVHNPHIEVGERLYRDNAVVLERPDWI